MSDPNHGPEVLVATWYANNEIICDAMILQEDGLTSCGWEVFGEEALIQLEVKDPLNAAGATSLQLVVLPLEVPRGVFQARVAKVDSAVAMVVKKVARPLREEVLVRALEAPSTFFSTAAHLKTTLRW